MAACRCDSTKRATAALAQLEPSERKEIGQGEEFDVFLFNRFMDAYRTIDYLRKGLSLSGYEDMEELYTSELSGVISMEELQCLSDIRAALVLFRTRRIVGFER